MQLCELAGIAAIFVFLLTIDLRFFAPGREATLRESALWALGWLTLGLGAAGGVVALHGHAAAVNYVTVYLVERSLSLDNLFVFVLLFSYFGIPEESRPRLLFWGITAALALRGLAILAGTALLERFHGVLYVLGALLLVVAYRVYRGVAETVDPHNNLVVRAVRRVLPVTDGLRGPHWFVREHGRRYATPAFLCLVAIVAADLAFAVDSIPAAFAITRDPLIIWTANGFALAGMRALFVLVVGLIFRLRYLDETLAVVLALIALKLLGEPFVKIGPVESLLMVALVFAVGIVASLIADRRDPVGEGRRRAGEPTAGGR